MKPLREMLKESPLAVRDGTRHQALRTEQIDRWKSGSMGKRLDEAFERWLSSAIVQGQVVAPPDLSTELQAYSAAGIPSHDVIDFGNGPGTELHMIFDSIEISEVDGCTCRSLLREMNRLGVEGCKRERERLVADLKLNAHHYTWIDRIRAAQRIAQSELVLRIDITDPIGWLFDEAVRRYEVIELGAKKDG